MVSAFGALSLAQNERLYGSDQVVEPADAQIAASSSWLVEVAGNTMGLFGSDGSLHWTVDIQALFELPPGYFFYAPSLQYDDGSGRWFLGGIASNTSVHDSWLLLAISHSGSPMGTWSWFITDVRYNNPSQCGTPCPNTVYFTRESIAVVGDKALQTEQAEICTNACSPLGSGGFIVIRKDQLLAGVQPSITSFDIGTGQRDFLAVQPQSVGGTYGNVAFLVWLKGGATSPPDRLGLLQITGLPYPDRAYWSRGNTVAWEKDYRAVMPTSNVLPAQPGGSLYASPTPITSAIYRDGQVVLAMNDGCGQVDCVRIDKIADFTNATPIADVNGPIANSTVPLQPKTDFETAIGLNGVNLFDASLAIDPYGNLVIGTAFSSPGLNPGMAVAGISAPINSTSTVMPTSRIVQGPSSYNCFSGSSNPWGAYMRSAPDPNNYRRVWMPAEVAVNSCWATAIVSATTGVGPQATKMSPAVGSTKGGQVVQIDGSFFVPDADQVLFGSTPGTIMAESSTGILVRSPPGVAGSVTVTVRTPDGTAIAGTFTYVKPGDRSAPPAAPKGRPRR
ncbi:MAG: IPT/TIG domain-containing protein [Candidatus Dormibacteraeota bacterium]|nr:IPT/TIG domain-containing protein [Candidatus Dormibacteraeota bacterium]